MTLKSPAALDLVTLCCRVLDDKKAGELAVLNVSAQSSITDYLVLATATSEPHLRTLRIELEKVLDRERVHLVGVETVPESGWIVIDAFDVMVHLFLAEARERYGLERLWRDAIAVPVEPLLAPPARAAKARAGKKKSAAGKRAAKSTGERKKKRGKKR